MNAPAACPESSNLTARTGEHGLDDVHAQHTGGHLACIETPPFDSVEHLAADVMLEVLSHSLITDLQCSDISEKHPEPEIQGPSPHIVHQ